MTSVEERRPRALFAGASRRWVRLLPWGVAFVLCVALLPTTIIVLTADYGLNGGVASALAVAQAAPLLLAVVRPLQAWYVVFAADLAGALALLTVDFPDRLLWPFPPMEIVGYVGLCLALGLRERRRTLLLVWLATAAANVTLGFFAPHGSGARELLLTILGGATLLLAGALRERSEVQRRLAEQETISEAERGRRTLLEERARIARELHDVVAHHMSVITVQADTAEYRLDRLPQDVREEFTTIAATARESLGEMRRLLGVLRNEDAHGELVPQPGLAQIGQLVEATSRTGGPVEFTPCEAEVPEAVGLSAYRIVQEALANVVRHAPGAATHVSLSVSRSDEDRGGERDEDRGGERLTVLVVNEPPPQPPAAPLEASGTGHGLVGMRERVRLVGGTLDAGPLPAGGFRVAAQLPLTEKGLHVTTRVIIVDDQAMVRAGFAALLAAQSDIDVVGEAPDGAQGVELSRRTHPDVVLMDVRMPEMDGLEAARRLLAPPPGVTHRPRVLMLTTFDVDDYVYEALRAGASGFLLKDAPPADLIAAVRVVAAGDALLAPSVTRRLIADFATQRPASRGKPAQRLKGLTERETEVLTLVARGRSNGEIAQTLVLAEQTVKTHVSRVLTKLDLRDRAQAVVFAYESGLVAPGE